MHDQEPHHQLRFDRGRRTITVVATAVAVSLGMAACGGGSTSGSKPISDALTPATLTLWTNGQPSPVDTSLVRSFEKLHPQIKIHVIAQPSSNYFALLRTSNIAHKGPDIALVWTGYYVSQNAPWLVKLNPYLSASRLRRLVEPQYSALNYDVNDGVYIAPVATQYYIGMYNKRLFAKAGISSPPQDWAELYSDCAQLKKMGVTPMEYGDQFSFAPSSFYTAFDLSYLLAGALTPQQWNALYTGKLPWTNRAISQQLTKWAALYRRGCTNKDVLTTSNPFRAYSDGKAAMMVTADSALLPSTLPNAVLRDSEPFAPPFTSSPTHHMVAMSGYGYGATTYGAHVNDAVAFLKYIDTPAAQAVVEKNFNPELKGIGGTAGMNPQHRQLLAWTNASNYTLYPFIDNFLQPPVYSAAQSVLPEVFTGQKTPGAALHAIEAALQALPPSARSLSHGSTS